MGSEPYVTVHQKNPQFHQQTGLFELYGERGSVATIVMLGDSLTQAVAWNELLSPRSVINRGIGGDTTFGFLERLDHVLNARPALCCIMGGINDLYESVPPEQIAKNIGSMVERLKQSNINVIIQSTLHVSPMWRLWEEKNRQIKELSLLLKQVAASSGSQFLDLNQSLAPHGVLKDEFTYDGVHLTAPAYRIWRDQLLPALEQQGL